MSKQQPQLQLPLDIYQMALFFVHFTSKAIITNDIQRYSLTYTAIITDDLLQYSLTRSISPMTLLPPHATGTDRHTIPSSVLDGE